MWRMLSRIPKACVLAVAAILVLSSAGIAIAATSAGSNASSVIYGCVQAGAHGHSGHASGGLLRIITVGQKCTPDAVPLSWNVQGPQGKPGPAGVIWKGPWSASQQYAPTDAVSYSGSSWIATAANSGATPSSSSAVWNLLAARGAQGPTGTSGPGPLVSCPSPPVSVKMSGTAVSLLYSLEQNGTSFGLQGLPTGLGECSGATGAPVAHDITLTFTNTAAAYSWYLGLSSSQPSALTIKVLNYQGVPAGTWTVRNAVPRSAYFDQSASGKIVLVVTVSAAVVSFNGAA